MTVKPDRGIAVRLASGLIGLTVAWAVPSGLAQAPDAGRQSGGALLEFPNFGPVPGSPESGLGPGPGALQPSMLAPEAGLIGGRRRAGRIPRSRADRGFTAVGRFPAMSLPASLP